MEARRSYMQGDFLALLGFVHSHSQGAVAGLDRTHVSTFASQVFPSACVPTQTAEPKGWTCSHHPGRSGPTWNPWWTILEKQSTWEGGSGTIRAVPFPPLLPDALLSPLQNPHRTPAPVESPGPG